MLDEKDIEALEKRFDLRYKTREDCDREMTEAAERHNLLDKQFAIINTKLSAILWGLGVLGTAVIGVLVKMLFKTP